MYVAIEGTRTVVANLFFDGRLRFSFESNSFIRYKHPIRSIYIIIDSNTTVSYKEFLSSYINDEVITIVKQVVLRVSKKIHTYILKGP